MVTLGCHPYSVVLSGLDCWLLVKTFHWDLLKQPAPTLQDRAAISSCISSSGPQHSSSLSLEPGRISLLSLWLLGSTEPWKVDPRPNDLDTLNSDWSSVDSSAWLASVPERQVESQHQALLFPDFLKSV